MESKKKSLKNFEQVYEETAGEDAFFQAANLVEAKKRCRQDARCDNKGQSAAHGSCTDQLVEGLPLHRNPMEDGVQINGMNVTMEGTNGTD